ncbi:EamA family transporter [Streptomyces niger]|uniref:EamA family transporter n=1 Tax=Streptomyces niger TaxID=66373 RepID=UPI000A9E6D5A|nr:EamA family transporter [Streptomyces niger]
MAGPKNALMTDDAAPAGEGAADRAVRRRRGRRVPAPALVLGSVCSVQIGQALGKGLFGTVGGPWGAVALRLGLAAALLLAVWRPRLPERRGDLLAVLALGTAIAGMNLVYPALRHLPLGAAVTIQLTGPLVVSLLAVRRRRDAAWGLLAVVGLFLFTDPGSARSLPLIGVAFAVASAVAMGTYLLLSRHVGARMTGGGPLALAVAWAALLSLPAGVAESGTRLLAPAALALGLLVAVLSAAVPYSLELTALRRLPARTVGVLQSLEPVVAGLAGAVLLDETLSAAQWAATGCIALASAGAVSGTARRPDGGEQISAYR